MIVLNERWLLNCRKRAAYQLFNQKCGSLIINYDMTRKFTSRIPLLKKAVNDWSGYDVYTSVNQFIRRIQTQNQSMPSVEVCMIVATTVSIVTVIRSPPHRSNLHCHHYLNTN